MTFKRHCAASDFVVKRQPEERINCDTKWDTFCDTGSDLKGKKRSKIKAEWWNLVPSERTTSKT